MESPVIKLQASEEKPRSTDETQMGTTKKTGNTRYRGRIEKIERPREGLWAVLADHSTEGQREYTDREGGEPTSQGPIVGKVKPGITFLW
jgi:hypothetical protein